MKITRVEPVHLRLPEVTDACDGTQDSLVILVHTDEGITGIGEVDSSPTVIKAILEAPLSHQICNGLANLIEGENPLDIARLWRKMYEGTIYYGRFGPALHAISGIDIALWDIAGKAYGQPVHRLLGGAERDRIRAYASVLFEDTPEKTRELGQRLVLDHGFRAVKFGWGPFGKDEGFDRDLASAARYGVGEASDLMIDVGCCWDWKTAVRREELLREFNPFWIEEPLAPDDLEGYRLLSERVPTRIAAGEEESGVPALERLIVEGGIDVVQPDVTRCGGLTAAMEVSRIAAIKKRMVANHTFKSGISIAASLHFIAAIPNAIAFEYCMAESPLRHETTVQDFPVVEGFVEIPQGLGLGVELDMDTIDLYRQT